MARRFASRRRRANRYREQNGICHWCRQPMLLLDPVPRYDQCPPNTCTLDHLDDRYSGRRRSRQDGERRTVAACRTCNHERGRQIELQVPIEERRRRAAH